MGHNVALWGMVGQGGSWWDTVRGTLEYMERHCGAWREQDRALWSSTVGHGGAEWGTVKRCEAYRGS